jgi:hypothetical protein
MALDFLASVSSVTRGALVVTLKKSPLPRHAPIVYKHAAQVYSDTQSGEQLVQVKNPLPHLHSRTGLS